MALKKHFFPYGSFSIWDGSERKFCEDKWLGTTTLQEQYSPLYNIVHHKGDNLTKVMETSPPTTTFRCDLFEPWLASCNELV
jgi:aminoglycoside N3'-acetyltransferase